MSFSNAKGNIPPLLKEIINTRNTLDEELLKNPVDFHTTSELLSLLHKLEVAASKRYGYQLKGDNGPVIA